MGKKKSQQFYGLKLFIFSITGNPCSYSLAMLHETKLFCRLVLFAVQLRKTPFLPSTKVSFGTEKRYYL
jgi:hypothetical protein